ncbi:DUF3987 domain-containing protein [Methylobacterium komagatae]
MDTSNYGPGRGDLQPIQADVAAFPAAAAPVMPSQPTWDTAMAVAFATALVGSGRFAVAAIHPDRPGAQGQTFTLPAERESLTDWIEERQGVWNLYFNVNEPVPQDQQQGKAGRIGKSDLSTLRGIAVDIDPIREIEVEPGGFERERERLREMAQRLWADEAGPSAIINSGGGFQFVSLFPEALPATAENITRVEAQSRGLAALYGGDTTDDVAHLFRLPGTVNLPNAAKKARGRKPVTAQGRVSEKGRRYTLDDLAAFAAPIDRPEAPAAAPPTEFDIELAREVCGQPTELPEQLTERLLSARHNHVGLDKLLSGERAGPGDRSTRDFAIACACMEADILDRAEVAAIVAAYSPDKFEAEEARGGRGRAETYLARTVNRALAHVAEARARIAFTPIDDEGNDAASCKRNAETEGFGDSEPADILGEDDPGILGTPPDGSLPEVIAAYARAEAARIGVPVIFSAMAALTVAGGAVGNALQIQPRRYDPTYTEPAAIWTVLVAPPGCAKSPTINSAAKPLRAVDARLMKASEIERQAYEARRAALGKDKTGLGPAPLRRRAVIDDVTPEQQIRLHQHNPRGLLRIVDEYVSFLDFGTYKKNGGGDRGKALGFFDGGSMTVDRVSEDRPIHADSVLMGLLSSTQPDKIGPLFRSLGVDGLSQRTLFILWDGVERRFIDQPPDLKALDEYASAVTALAGIDKVSGHTVRLSSEAHDVADEIERRIRAHAHLPNASSAWDGHIPKWGKIFPRLILIFHALETWDAVGGIPADAVVTANTVRKAGRLALFLLKHSWQFYRANSAPQDRAAAVRWIAGWIVAHPEHDRFTPRHIERAYKDVQKDRPAFLAALRGLEEAGWVRPSKPAAPGSAGPREWAVNPRVYERYAEHGVRERAARADKRAKIKAAAEAQREGSNGV